LCCGARKRKGGGGGGSRSKVGFLKKVCQVSCDLFTGPYKAMSMRSFLIVNPPFTKAGTGPPKTATLVKLNFYLTFFYTRGDTLDEFLC
jgi:hypothetical protein